MIRCAVGPSGSPRVWRGAAIMLAAAVLAAVTLGPVRTPSASAQTTYTIPITYGGILGYGYGGYGAYAGFPYGYYGAYAYPYSAYSSPFSYGYNGYPYFGYPYLGYPIGLNGYYGNYTPYASSPYFYSAPSFTVPSYSSSYSSTYTGGYSGYATGYAAPYPSTVTPGASGPAVGVAWIYCTQIGGGPVWIPAGSPTYGLLC